MVAAAFDSPAVAEVLLAHGADPRARDTLNGNTPLDFAALSGHAGMAEMLLSLDVDVNGRASHNGETPLHYASLYGHRKVIALLAANGAELDAADNSGVRAAAIRDEAQADAGGGDAARPRREARRPARRRQCRRCCARAGADRARGRT